MDEREDPDALELRRALHPRQLAERVVRLFVAQS